MDLHITFVTFLVKAQRIKGELLIPAATPPVALPCPTYLFLSGRVRKNGIERARLLRRGALARRNVQLFRFPIFDVQTASKAARNSAGGVGAKEGR